MRRRAILLSSLAVASISGVAVIGTASSAPGRADLTVGALAEPPETATAGSRFRVSFSVVNQAAGRARKQTTTRFFLDKTPDNKKGRRGLGKKAVGPIRGQNEQSARAKLRVPGSLAADEYFLVACADTGKKVKESKEGNNCRVSGQTIGVGQSRIGPPGAPGTANETTLDNVTLPIGRPTIPGFIDSRPGDDEFSNQRRTLAAVGPITIVADCKRTTNGDQGEPDDPFGSAGDYDEDGDEAKILVYTDRGTLTFNSMGASSRRNIPPGLGETEDSEPDDSTQADDTNGGEGAHMAIGAARDPDQENPGDRGSRQGVVAFAYKVKSVYISHSNGTELILTGFAGIDVLGAEDQCIFGGVLKTVRVVP